MPSTSWLTRRRLQPTGIARFPPSALFFQNRSFFHQRFLSPFKNLAPAHFLWLLARSHVKVNIWTLITIVSWVTYHILLNSQHWFLQKVPGASLVPTEVNTNSVAFKTTGGQHLQMVASRTCFLLFGFMLLLAALWIDLQHESKGQVHQCS